MIEVKAQKSDDGVDVNIELKGKGNEIFREALAVIESLYRSLDDIEEKDLQDIFLAAVSARAMEWISQRSSELEKVAKEGDE